MNFFVMKSIQVDLIQRNIGFGGSYESQISEAEMVYGLITSVYTSKDVAGVERAFRHREIHFLFKNVEAP